jgi:hypothetical protein
MVSATRCCIGRDSVQGAGPREVSNRNDSRFSDFPVTVSIHRGTEQFGTIHIYWPEREEFEMNAEHLSPKRTFRSPIKSR